MLPIWCHCFKYYFLLRLLHDFESVINTQAVLALRNQHQLRCRLSELLYLLPMCTSYLRPSTPATISGSFLVIILTAGALLIVSVHSAMTSPKASVGEHCAWPSCVPIARWRRLRVRHGKPAFRQTLAKVHEENKCGVGFKNIYFGLTVLGNTASFSGGAGSKCRFLAH